MKPLPIPEWCNETALYDWGKHGLRSRGKRRLLNPHTGRRTSTFDPFWMGEWGQAHCPCGITFMRKLRSLTDDVYTVYKKKGKYWVRDRIIAPRWAVVAARAEAPRDWAARYTESEHTKALDWMLADMEGAA